MKLSFAFDDAGRRNERCCVGNKDSPERAGLLVVMERVMVEVEEDMTREEEISAPM